MRRVLGGSLAVLVMISAFFAIRADALPIAPPPPAPVQGIPEPCPSLNPWPGDDVGIEEIKTQLAGTFGLRLEGGLWTDQYRPSIRIIWETLDAVSCTDYLDVIKQKAPGIGLNAVQKRTFAWGDWSLTRTNFITLDFVKFERALEANDEGRLVRLVIHELGHAWSTDRHASPAYWNDFRALTRQEGHFSDYAGSRDSEIFADVVGYYVGRCALDNPYDEGGHQAYYDYAKDVVFGGKEFGPPPGETPDCQLPDPGAEVPLPDDIPEPSGWMRAVSEG